MIGPGEVRYAKSGRFRIAYQQFGDGDLDLLIVPGFISNLDMIWEMPTFRHMFERLGTFARCIVFDKRGTGLSDREMGFGSLEERADDLRAVLDDAGVSRTAVFAYSEGGPLSLVLAAARPDMVSAMALYGTMARSQWAPDFPAGIRLELAQPLIEVLEETWGQGVGLRQFVSGSPLSEATTQLIARYERGAASPALARHIIEANLEIDVRAVLPAITQPTLVLHTAGDPIIPVGIGRHLADNIGGARLVEGPGDFHMPWSVEEMWFLDEVETFLTGHRPGPVQAERFLSTVLFTDIVDSTVEASRLGDRAWRGVLDDHDRLAAAAVARERGRVVKTTGDGLLALFDSPSRAIACARAIKAAVDPVGVRVRAGIHTGEVEGRGDDVGGLGVHIGARIAGLAGAGEVWVSRTVRDLTAGSGLTFDDRGRHALKGVPEEWELYSVAG
ncbi:MAG TPA: adenylate/guanylate cyclase domain-containing protein [Acidimicrobiales bacterium]|nr:adenylate/guanylate cyclase domain-containing protein [Acidimicrobiales bacterium]